MIEYFLTLESLLHLAITDVLGEGQKRDETDLPTFNNLLIYSVDKS
jgi:hypothetical protein